MSHPAFSRAALAAAALTLAMAATASAQTPEATPGGTAVPPASQAVAMAPAETRYVLLDVGGKSLPVRIEKEWRCHEDVAAATLLLREDGRWRLETTVRETCGTRSRMDGDDEDGMYRAQGETLRFFDDDGHRHHREWSPAGEIELDDLDQGTLTDGGLLTVRLADGETVLRFRREGA